MELVDALAQLVSPLDQILSMQRSTARRFWAASLVVAVVACAIAMESCRSHAHDISMDRRIAVMLDRIEEVEVKLDSHPTIDIEPAPSGVLSARPKLVITPPIKPATPPTKLMPAETTTVKIPLDLPRENVKRK